MSSKGRFSFEGVGGGGYGPLFLNFLDPPLLLAGPFVQGFIWYCLNRGGAFAFGYFARLSFFLFNVKARLWTCCDAMLFPGIPDPLSLTLGGGDVPLVFGFIRRDNLAAWGKFFVNLYELKPRI